MSHEFVEEGELQLADQVPADDRERGAAAAEGENIARRVPAPPRRAADEIARLRDSVAAGNFGDRAQLTGVNATDKEVLTNVNCLLEMFTASAERWIACVNCLALGDVPPRLEGAFHGRFAELQDGLNRCVDLTNRFRASLRQMAEEQGESMRRSIAMASRKSLQKSRK